VPNKLIHSTSPYLLQHAHNPVNWQEWGSESLEEAKNLDKPILVSIGYSSCHWCHVMERESFENHDVGKVMNESFVCIKVDREERPDIDHIYMEAVQAMGMNGGWPLNVFLTPNQKPFYGGTYFPPQNWVRLLAQIAKTFEVKRDEINQSADDLANHLQRSDLDRFAKDESLGNFEKDKLDQQFDILKSKFDNKWGGIEKAPKFVMPSVWLWLLRYHVASKNKTALDMLLLTLKQMTHAGLYDQLGGGFSRYSVDGEWFAPHFEKMLYDNAQLLSLYAEAYSITKDSSLKSVVDETVGWLQREMTHKDGGFYSALDADSEGIEGKFYAWTYDEMVDATGDIHSVMPEYFQITKEGNWEHGLNILCRMESTTSFMKDHNINQNDLDILVGEGKKKMFAFREKKVRPTLDDKILTGWNAMTVQGLVDCYKAFADPIFLEIAVKNISFIESNLIISNKVHRAFKNKHSTTEGFLEDYAFLIQAYSSLYQVTFEEKFLNEAERWTNYVLKNFYDSKDGFFHFSSVNAEQLIAKKKEVFDNVIPSSNSVMARNLFRLGTLLDNNEWKRKAIEMTSKLSGIITTEPVYMSNWAILFSEITMGINEVVIVGSKLNKIRSMVQENYFPFALFLGTKSKSDLPLFLGREARGDKTLIYVCRNKVCQLPVENVNEALQQMQPV